MNFEKGLVAVTGPNGSGKSNILDAIMFAIGETSPKSLRVEKMQSLYHDSNSSSHRLVRVSLSFDNSDRGIPMDSDNVTLTREMEGLGGESKYLLNGKAVSKSTIMELLEVVLAAPNKLNIVQQGMITRISELNSEERRKIIEDIVGLSYFDEKKAESIKQLDEADRRLEVAFARMGEIRKRIDELEVERNDQLRYDHVGQELKRFKAVQLSNNIRSIRQKLSSGSAILDSNTTKSSELGKRLDDTRAEIERLEADKLRFMQEVDAVNKAKANVAGKISGIVHDSERTKAMLGEAERRIADIERRLPQLDGERLATESRNQELMTQSDQIRSEAEAKKTEISESKIALDRVNAELEEIGSKMSKFTSFRLRFEKRQSRISSLRSRIELEAAKLQEKLKSVAYRSEAGSQTLKSIQDEIDSAEKAVQEMTVVLEKEQESMRRTVETLSLLSERKDVLERELGSSSAILAKAEKLATKFEERASVAKNAMNEDLAIAELMKDGDNFGIQGLVHNLVKWDQNYERAVLAAASEWMKAFVVKDVRSMVAMASYAKERRLPRLRIIPLDVMMQFEPESDMPEDDVNIIGRLSDFVHSDLYPGLAQFLFSGTIVTKNSSSAYLLASRGYRAVSYDGELFEPSGGSVALDFGSKISDLTRAILLGDSVAELKEMLARLSTTIESRTLELQEISTKISFAESEKMRLALGIEHLESKVLAEAARIESKRIELDKHISAQTALQTEQVTVETELSRMIRRIELIEPTLARLATSLQSIGDENSTRQQLAQKSQERNQINKSLDSANFALAQLNSTLGGLDSRLALDSRQLKQLEEERERLAAELQHRKGGLVELAAKSQSLEGELRALRDQEQQIIDSSGSAYSVLQEYEVKIKSLAESERRASKEFNVLERESALLRKDIADLGASESRLMNDLVWLGYKELLEEMDVLTAIKELSAEFEEVKTRINLRADEAYVQVMDGYRGMSGRKNQLENERNSIFSFIQQIEKEKKDVFMEAFQRVDSDIRTTFEKMTGGEARLEIENPEEIFTSGVMLLVRFPNKTVARESTALSGGEKTIAATVFLLALQSLKPSPFYLMDEVDAHLDAQNTERLSKVLLERSRDNQIIMVTLKDSTVAKAALIYGVYPRDGASQVVKYRNPAQVPLAQIAATESKQ